MRERLIMDKDTTEECVKIIDELKKAYDEITCIDNSDISKALAIAKARILTHLTVTYLNDR